MKLALSLLASAAIAQAHFTMQYVWVNGVDQGQNTYLRIPPNNNPVTDVTSTDLTCNVGGLTGSGVSTASIAAGASITLEWHQHAQRTGEDPIAGGHKGPVIVYVAKAPSTAAAFDGQGAVWTKIYQSGLLDASSSQWATDVINANEGKHTFTIPSSLPAGEYLIRAEIIALHVASSYPGAQFYIGCAQVKLTGGGSASPPKIALPGAYQGSDPGITVNIYNNLQSYTPPGGAVWSGSSDSGTTSGGVTSGTVTTTSKAATTTSVTGTTTSKAATTTTPTSGTVAQYGQCGGSGYSGPTACASPYTCSKLNDYYSQCV